MAKSKIETRAQNVEDAFKEIQTYLIGKLPIGDELNILFNARSNIRKERLLRFFESFRNELQKFHGKPLSADEITSEEFLDILEAIMLKIQSTQSLYKVERFRNILLKQAVLPVENQLALKYVQVVDELTDVQMLMLDVISVARFSVKNYSDIVAMIWMKYNPNVDSSEFKYEDFYIEHYGLSLLISFKEVCFYLADLISKGLIENKMEDELTIPNMKFQNWPNNSNQSIKVKRQKKELFSATLFTKSLLEFLKTED